MDSPRDFTAPGDGGGPLLPQPSDAPVVQQRPAAAPALSAHVSRGFTWFVLQTVASKVAGAVAQIFLARLLSPHDFGTVALAYTATGIPSMFRQTGVTQILVGRQERFRRWAVDGFWFELALALVAVAGMCVAAPIGALVFRAPEVFGLTLVIALGAGVGALGSVSNAALMMQLRFREQAFIGLIANVLQSALSVLLAFCHFGAYSFVIPVPIAMGYRVFATWRKVRRDAPPIRFKFNWIRWRVLFMDSSLNMGASLVGLLSVMVYPLIIRSYGQVSDVGLFFFAWNLSIQVVQLLSNNLFYVLFPTLSKLQVEPARQISAFYRAAQMLVYIATPICLLECVLARPVIVLIFGANWLPAALPLQIMALATIFGILTGPIQNLLMAQLRYRAYFIWSLVGCMLTIPLVVLGMDKWGLPGACLATLVITFAANISGICIAEREYLSALLKQLGAFGPSLISSTGAACLAYIILKIFPILAINNLAEMISFAGLFSLFFAILSLLLCRRILGELWTAGKAILRCV